MSESVSSKRLTGEHAILARRYAGALYDLADEAKQTDLLAEELRALNKMQEECAEFRALATNRRISRIQQSNVLQQISKSANLSPLATNFLGTLAHNRRLDLLSGIISAFFDKLAEARGEFHADICAAQMLSPAQEEKLRAELQKLMGGTIKLNIKQVPALLGGLTIKIGSRLIDASLRGKLARLEQNLKAQREAV